MYAHARVDVRINVYILRKCLFACVCMYMQTQAYKHKKSAENTCSYHKFPKMHVCATARHYYITFSFGLNVFIKNFSFSFCLKVLFLFSLKNGKKYFGFSLEHLSICPLSRIILFELSRICWLWTITRFLNLFFSPMFNSLHPRHSITYTTFLALQVMGALTLNILPFLKSNYVPSINCEHSPQLDRMHFITEFSQLLFKLNLAFGKILLRFCGCLLLFT